MAIKIKSLPTFKFFKVFLLTVFLLQIGTLFHIASQQIDIPAVIEANSLDAAKGIEIANNTVFYNDKKWESYRSGTDKFKPYIFDDNRWRPYGPLYYQLARIAFTINKNIGYISYQNSNDINYIRLSFSLISVSLIALISLCLLVGYCINKDIYITVLCANLLLFYLLSINDVIGLIFQNHPDLLMALFAASLYLITIKCSEDCSYKNIALFGLVGGLGFLTKFSFFLIYLPALISLFVFHKNIKILVAIPIITIISYFIIGAPQSFEVMGIYDFLKDQNNYRDTTTLDSILFWIYEIFHDLYKIFLLILFLVIFFSDRNYKENLIKTKILYLNLLFFPLLIISTISFAHKPSYYVIPIVFAFCLLLTIIIKNFIDYLFFKKQNSKIFSYAPLVLMGLIFFIIHIASFNLIPINLVNYGNSVLESRKAIKETIYFVNSLPKEALKIKTAYFPSSDNLLPSIDRISAVNDYISSGRAKYLLVSRSWYARYFKPEPSNYDLGGESYENYKFFHNFWSQFNNNDKKILVKGNYYYLIYHSGNDRVYELISK